MNAIRISEINFIKVQNVVTPQIVDKIQKLFVFEAYQLFVARRLSELLLKI